MYIDIDIILKDMSIRTIVCVCAYSIQYFLRDSQRICDIILPLCVCQFIGSFASWKYMISDGHKNIIVVGDVPIGKHSVFIPKGAEELEKKEEGHKNMCK